MDTQQKSGGHSTPSSPHDNGVVVSSHPDPSVVPAGTAASTAELHQVADVSHKVLNPSAHFVQELHDTQPTPVAPHLAGLLHPEASHTPPTQANASIAADMLQINSDQPAPSGRWQMFWYALSVLTLGLLFISVSIVTSGGTLEKLLLGLKPNPEDVLFGTRVSITIANSLLGTVLVCLPLFIISTIKVDRYKLKHPTMATAGMKKISYFFMVLAILFLIGQVATTIFQALNYTFSVINIVPLMVDIGFVMAYFFWLYTTVAEDRIL